MKSLYSFLSRAKSASDITVTESFAKNQTESLLKKFILRSAGVVAFFLFLGGSVWGQCTHTIQLTDTYGDGWNGGTVSVSVNGTTVLTNITLSSGSGPANFTFTAAASQTIRVWRTAAGSYPSEMRIQVNNPSGNAVIALVQPVTGSATTGGSTGTASCPAPGYCQPTGTGASSYITNVVTSGGITNLSNASGFTAGGYGNYTAQNK
jgi:hypothetical protein